MWSSEELIQHIAQGSREARGELYDRHASAVHAVALAILREAEDAEDVVQTFFVEACHSAERYDARRSQPAAWLAALAQRRALGRQLRHPRVVAWDPQTLDRPFSS
jgi:RNA polymerase sigma-70 factor (ECF subfamily)